MLLRGCLVVVAAAVAAADEAVVALRRYVPRNVTAPLPRCDAAACPLRHVGEDGCSSTLRSSTRGALARLAARGVAAVRVRGLFNCGTNFFVEVLGGLGVPTPGASAEGFFHDGRGTKRWKHAFPSTEKHRGEPENDGELDVVLARHPVAWMASTRNRSYTIRCCGADRTRVALPKPIPPGENAIYRKTPWAESGDPYGTGCREHGQRGRGGGVLASIPWRAALDGPCDFSEHLLNLSSLPGIWNAYYREQLTTNARALVVRYEDAVRAPAAVAVAVAAAARCAVAAAGLAPGVTSARAGWLKPSATFSAADRDFVVAERWRDDFPPDVLAALCAALDPDLLAALRYACAAPNPRVDGAAADARLVAEWRANAAGDRAAARARGRSPPRIHGAAYDDDGWGAPPWGAPPPGG